MSELTPFPTRDAAGAALAAKVADDLKSALAERGAAVLAVSGGSTPVPFFGALSTADLAWDRVVVTLVDERWVPETSERSNARLVKTTLLTDRAAKAAFVPLFGGERTVADGLDAARARLDADCRQIDALVLGMGGDAHTASFFPGGDGLASALDMANDARVVGVVAEAAGEPRITLTLAELVHADRLYLHITGADKRAVLETALQPDTDPMAMPIRAVFDQRVPVVVFAE